MITDIENNLAFVQQNGVWGIVRFEGTITHTLQNHTTTQGSDEITVIYNGNPIKFTHPTTIRGDYVFYPLEDLLLALSGGHGWNGYTSVIYGSINDRLIEVSLINLVYTANGQVLDVPVEFAPFVENDRTYVYLDIIAESLGLSILWDGATRTVTIK
jgi:hypothetical protein